MSLRGNELVRHTNLIFYVCRIGYEIKTWIYADDNETRESIISKGREALQERGVDLEEIESYDWEWY